MKKILIISPRSIAGSLIMNGFAHGFKSNDCKVLSKVVDELKKEDVEKFKPDMIFGYDYSFLMDENCTKIVKKSGCKNIVCYFADEPKGKFALGEKDYLYEELKKFNPKIFIWDEDFLNEFENSTYLPLAINPEKYQTAFSGYKYQITFVGRPLTNIRQEILCAIVKTFGNKLSIFSYEKHFLKSVEEIKSKNLLTEEELAIYSNCFKGFIEKEEDLAKIYNSSKINLNINLQGKSSLNYRVFEVLASGGFLLTDERLDLENYFKISKHLETYKTTEDLMDKIDFYLKNPNISKKIAILGRNEVFKKHTFDSRAKAVLKCLFKNI